MAEVLNRKYTPPDNSEGEKQQEAERKSQEYLKLAKENPHKLTEEIKKNPKTEPLLRQILWDTEYERIKDLNPNKLSEDTDIAKMQWEIYSFVDINPETDRNPTKDKFIKWLIDSIIVGNAELAMKIIETKWAILKNMIQEIFSWEWLKNIAEWFWKSVMELFSGDAYKTGKSLGELWLITVGSWAGWFVLKRLWKWAMKTGEKVAIKAEKETIVSQGLQKWGKGVEVLWKVVQAPYNIAEAWVKKAWWAIRDGVRWTSEVIGNIPSVQKVAEPLKRVISESKERLSEESRRVMETTKERAKEVLALASVPILIGSKDGAEGIWKLRGQIWAVGDLEGIKPFSKEKQPSVHESVKIPERSRTLYEDPSYVFLASEKYQKFREAFPNLSQNDIIGEGNNAIILQHPDKNLVIKIAKEWNVDKLDVEFKNHEAFRNKLFSLQQVLKDKPEYGFIQKFKIPEVISIDSINWIYEMEKVHWLSLKTLVIIEHHKDALKDLPQWWHNGLTDNQVDILLHERWLQTYPKNTTEDRRMWKNQVDIDFMVDIERAGSNAIEGNPDIKWIEKLFLSRWFNHWDLHWWNIMQGDDGNLYIIDFWRSKITP